MKTMQDLSLTGRRVIIREDFNVPVRGGAITDDTRLRAALPTIDQAKAGGATIILISHLGRPTEGEVSEEFSLRPVAAALGDLLGHPVGFEQQWLDGFEPAPGSITLCENVRFLKGEKANDDGLAEKMAQLGDVFVNDAFATAHRAQASTHGIAKFAREACAGPLLKAEVDALGRALEDPARPMVAIVGGAKVSTKLQVLEALVEKVDQLIVGGGIANTFIKAMGHDVGASLVELDMLDIAKRLIDSGANIPIPTDVVVAKTLSEDADARVVTIDAVAPDDMILDVGPQTATAFAAHLEGAGTIVWNGPLGVFEIESFASGTRQLAEAIGRSPAFSIAGGGDTLAAIAQFGVSDGVSYISTGGGAFLEFLEGKELPAIAILKQ
ncbi:MAG: phosphoglycerate kinase [Pseudomonadota bacterium]